MATRVTESRSRRYDPAETRQRVLEAANLLFSTQGFAKTGTADIARAADVSEGSIFYHFGSKRSLLEELGRMYGERMCAAMEAGDRLEDLEPGITIARCFAYCATQKSWENIVNANCAGSASHGKMGLKSNPDAEPFYRASHEVVSAWVENQYRAMAKTFDLADLDTKIAAELTYAVVGAALDIAFAPDADEALRQRVEAETIRYVRTACGLPHQPKA
ncbi:TetR/AcrR family transcriptional regulator [Sphingosinicella soli]|uniref:AcrR family transcriptional regulator n=1 Tax=Sphingosinicella soli TaxID=333708 RepID=A0A7W7B357_9SPHN|nr:TetR/AcrR family transcriptional regulator [Sphingosinicella soli]MBB4632117.1 AcrR family transcriptional regulator [Sphingosinicella soli]